MPTEAACAAALELVAPAEQAYHSRWRLSSLKRVDADLHEALTEQIELYHAAFTIGASDELRVQSEAMVRGWAAACKAMEAAQAPEDAYLMGMDDASGIQVVIAEHKGSRDALAARYGEPLVLLTPNEVATLLATVEIVRQAKQHFPDAELMPAAKVEKGERI
ncbi:hypothetical protein ACFSTI_25055 [Rhizorhabdus histidinilytica]|uniref:Uncharacterized protein n=1 Tax=Rhizorhabdus histidinilytica TaxID=439228 RepID=A0A1T5A813_9SPHN|nr:hypothetical protein [Rhizorhabdus histidinilytica]SKB31068.1 hypothetical protein SAMN06295920_101687 [Rhizorhabdus histidinilytica]